MRSVPLRWMAQMLEASSAEADLSLAESNEPIHPHARGTSLKLIFQPSQLPAHSLTI